jgi:propionyl-CoA carboxylase alpha chain
MFYDPMIAKLCTWGATRDAAIEEMRLALDTFEVEGIGHNLPFVAAVMDHPRFTSGNITTAFIAEEYPDGFKGAMLPDSELARVAAAAAAMNRVAEIRISRISGTMDNHTRKVGNDWVVTLDHREFCVHVAADPTGSTVTVEGDQTYRIKSDWKPGQPLARIHINGEIMVIKVGPIPMGYRMRLRGADMKVYVRTPRAAEFAKLMVEKTPPDTSKYLLCPMPGLLVKLLVGEGDEVQEGQTLATVEAMKMENNLKAERAGVVKKVKAAAGSSLRVDDVILEFE